MHIFADLQPYICTFADCKAELAQFPNRAAWAEHEFCQHRITRSWSCPECPQAFDNVPEWQNHIQKRHCLIFSDRNLNNAKDMAYKTEATRIENDECPLCRMVVGKPRRAFVKHVGRHMEEIALMALPRNVEDDSEEGSVHSQDSAAQHSANPPQQPITAFEDAFGGPVVALDPPSQDYPKVNLLFICSIEAVFQSTCFFCYIPWPQSLKMCFPSRHHLSG